MMSSVLKVQCYDVCIVGAGMVGSSAAKYAALRYYSRRDNQPANVCLIGPEEPKNRDGHTIFAAHYDEARITRSTATDTVWGVLARRSILRYRHIESESGVKFYAEVGCLSVGDPTRDDFVASTLRSAEEQKIDIAILESPQVQEKFPYLYVSSDHQAIWETKNAGYINPRKLVQAQKLLAQKYGCDIISDIVLSVRLADVKETSQSVDSRDIVIIETVSGKQVYARKVLLATNGFTEGFYDLLPTGIRLDMQTVTQGVVLFQVSSSVVTELRSMPTMLLRSVQFKENSGEQATQDLFDCYVLPPVKYPDGKFYIKLGHGKKYDRHIAAKDIPQWYCKLIPSELFQILKTEFHSAFPGVMPVSVHGDTCVTVDTSTGRPYIDHVTPWLCVAVGCCGSAAKSSDEIGRLAAQLLTTGQWGPDELLKHEDFRIRLRQHSVL